MAGNFWNEDFWSAFFWVLLFWQEEEEVAVPPAPTPSPPFSLSHPPVGRDYVLRRRRLRKRRQDEAVYLLCIQ